MPLLQVQLCVSQWCRHAETDFSSEKGIALDFEAESANHRQRTEPHEQLGSPLKKAEVIMLKLDL